MSIQDDPKFKAFAKQALRSIDSKKGLSGSALFVKAALKSFLENKSLEKQAKELISCLENNVTIIGIKDMKLSDIEHMPINFAFSTSCGIGVKTPAENVYFKITVNDSKLDSAKLISPPYVIAGVNSAQRVIIPNDPYNISTKAHGIAVERQKFIYSLEDVPVLKRVVDADMRMVGINDAIFKQMGFKFSSKHRPSDYGAIGFEQINGEYIEIEQEELLKLRAEKGQFVLSENRPVVVVPFKFDIKELNDQRISHDDQRSKMNDLWMNKKELEKIAKETDSTVEMLENIIECYLDYDRQHYKPV